MGDLSFLLNFFLILTLHVLEALHHPHLQTQILQLPILPNCLTLPRILLKLHPPMPYPFKLVFSPNFFKFFYLFDDAISTSGIGGGQREVDVVVDESSPPIIGWPCSTSCPLIPLPTVPTRSPLRRVRRTEI